MCLSISVLSSVSNNVQFSCTEKDSGLRDRYDEVIFFSSFSDVVPVSCMEFDDSSLCLSFS